jgi:unsaturated chondroitin disaccharide hydrolase
MIDRERLVQKCEQAMEFAGVQVRNLIEAHPDYFPMYTMNGKWKHDGEAWTTGVKGSLVARCGCSISIPPMSTG